MSTEHLELDCATFPDNELEVADGSGLVQLNIDWIDLGVKFYHKFHIDPKHDDPERLCAAIMSAADSIRSQDPDW